MVAHDEARAVILDVPWRSEAAGLVGHNRHLGADAETTSTTTIANQSGRVGVAVIGADQLWRIILTIRNKTGCNAAAIRRRQPRAAAASHSSRVPIVCVDCETYLLPKNP